MARLPQPGGDIGNWGDILNEYLSVSHGLDGSLKDGSIGSHKLEDGVIGRNKLTSSVSDTLDKADSALQDVSGLLTAGANVSLSGDGTSQSPYVINASSSGGDVVGPVSSTDQGVARFDASSGKLLKNSLVTIDDDGVISQNGITGVALYVGRSATINDRPYINIANGRAMVGYNGNSGNLVLQSSTAKGIEFNVNNSLFGNGAAMHLTPAGYLGLLTNTPTHSLTMSSSTSGVAFYNTGDQVTNYERLRLSWSNNTLLFGTESGGTGFTRSIAISAGNFGSGGTSNLTVGTNVGPSSNSAFLARRDSTGIINLFEIYSSGLTGNSNQTALLIDPVVSQSGAGGYTILKINPTESSVGTGPKYLTDMQFNGTSRFSVSSAGTMAVTGNARFGSSGSPVGLTLYASQGAANGLQVLSTDGMRWFSVGSVGAGIVEFNTQGGHTLVGPNSAQYGSARFNINTGNDTAGGLAIRANSGTQSEDLLQIQSSTGSPLARINATGALVLGSTSQGFLHYNTSDQTTNYERARAYWSNNSYIISTEAMSGTSRYLHLSSGPLGSAGFSYISIGSGVGPSGNAGFLVRRDSTAIGNLIQIYSSGLTGGSLQNGLVIDPVISQSGAGGYTMLKINPSESSTGSGVKLLADLQVGGVSKFTVSNTGQVTLASQKITGLANGTAATDAAAFGQIPVAGSGITNSGGTWSVSSGGATTVVTVSTSTYTFPQTNAVWKGTLQASCTFSLPAVSPGGSEQIISAIFIQDATGGRTVTLPTGGSTVSCLWASGIAPSIPTTANSIARVTFQNIDGQWYGAIIGTNYA